jgi:hypothetical protein
MRDEQPSGADLDFQVVFLITLDVLAIEVTWEVHRHKFNIATLDSVAVNDHAEKPSLLGRPFIQALIDIAPELVGIASQAVGVFEESRNVEFGEGGEGITAAMEKKVAADSGSGKHEDQDD